MDGKAATNSPAHDHPAFSIHGTYLKRPLNWTQWHSVLFNLHRILHAVSARYVVYQQSNAKIGFVQGLDLDSQGRVVAGNTPGMRRSDFIAEQEAWAMNSDKKASEWVENMGHLGGKAMDNAGRMTQTLEFAFDEI